MSSNNNQNQKQFQRSHVQAVLDYRFWWTLTKFIIPDLKSLPKIIKIILPILLVYFLVNNFIDFNYWIQPGSTSHWFWFLGHKSWAVWKQVFFALNGTVGLFGVVSVITSSFGKISTYFWGILYFIISGLFEISIGYYGIAQISFFFLLPAQLWGYYGWYWHLNKNQEIITRRTKWWQWFIIAEIGFILTVMFYFEIPGLSKALTGGYQYEHHVGPHMLDALSASFNLIAQTLMFLRLPEQWFFWLAIDVMQVLLYVGIDGSVLNLNMILANGIMTTLSLLGIYWWWFKLQRTKSKANSLKSQGKVAHDY